VKNGWNQSKLRPYLLQHWNRGRKGNKTARKRDMYFNVRQMALGQFNWRPESAMGGVCQPTAVLRNIKAEIFIPGGWAEHAGAFVFRAKSRGAESSQCHSFDRPPPMTATGPANPSSNNEAGWQRPEAA
jgi:hypothetical protein